MVDGRLVAAAQEERFTRKKHDHNFPKNAVDYCLREAKIQPEDLDYVVFYDKPLLKFERLLETYLAFAPAGFRSFCRAIFTTEALKVQRTRSIGPTNDGDGILAHADEIAAYESDGRCWQLTVWFSLL